MIDKSIRADYAIQGGGPNYLGKQKIVKAPKKWQSSPDHDPAELAYITEKEKDILIALDVHGSLKDGKPNRGPSGIISLQGDMGSIGGGGSSGGGSSGGGGGEGGGGYQDRIQQIAAAQARAAAASRAAEQQAAAQRDMQATIAKAEKAEAARVATTISGGEGKVDVGFQEALRKQKIAQPKIDTEPKIDVGFQEILRKKQIEEDLRQKQQDPNFGQFFRPQPVVEKKPSGFLKGLGTLAATTFLPALLPAKLAKTYTTYKQLKTASSLAKKFGLTKDDKMLSLQSKFLNSDMRKQLLKDDTPKVANLTNKKKITKDDGDRGNNILPESLQSTVSESTKRFLSPEMKEQYTVQQNKMKAALAEGYYVDRNGKRIALDDEKINALTKFITKIDDLLIDPVMMADGGRIDKSLMGRSRDI
jgi:hypothetical protein